MSNDDYVGEPTEEFTIIYAENVIPDINPPHGQNTEPEMDEEVADE